MMKYGTRLKTPSLDCILGVYECSTRFEREEGRTWYPDAGAWCRATGRLYGVPGAVVAAMAATLSPKISWVFTVRDVLNLLGAWSSGANPRRVKCAALGANKRKAIKILGEGRPAVSGSKVSAFYANLIGDYNRVTVDVWMYRAAIGSYHESSQWLTPRQYERFETVYVEAADLLGYTPARLQATLWLTVQRLARNRAVQYALFDAI
jgi:hypothetical protein